MLGDGTFTGSLTPVDVVGLETSVTAIDAGWDHSCALTESGGVQCWGYNFFGQLGDDTTEDRNTPVAVVGLSSGMAELALGGDHTCALTMEGDVKCWGDNDYGQLGDGTQTDSSTPQDVVGLGSKATALAAGYDHHCALVSGGAVKCWGNNATGQLGDGTTTQRDTPVDVVGLTSGITSLTSKYNHTCALTSNGGVKCWGNNAAGQLGDGTTTQRTLPVDVVGLDSGQTTLTAGFRHTCALASTGGARCWGSNASGQLGDGTMTWRSLPVDVGVPENDLIDLAGGYGHTCGLTSDNGVRCWGANSTGQIGDGTTTQVSTPVQVVGLETAVTALTTGAIHTCALTAEGGVKCWGANYHGQLGDGTFINCSTPVNVTQLGSTVTTVDAGSWHTCALISGDGVKCWGDNHYGQLGNGLFSSSFNVPVDVEGLTEGVTALALGESHTCALTTSGGVKCWGRNDHGQLGDNTHTPRNTPVDVVGLSTGVTVLAAGSYHTCALTEAGEIRCWGNNETGQLGDGTLTDRLTPVEVGGLEEDTMIDVIGGNDHTCALTSEGGVKCWGDNAAGQLGDGTTVSRSIPTDVQGLERGVESLATGSDHTCVLTDNGRAKCWGYDGTGTLGIGTVVQRWEPVEVVIATTPYMTLNYTNGQPGSFFTVTGWHFLSESQATLSINGNVLTSTLTINPSGNFLLFLDTSSAEVGGYKVTASVNPSASAMFILSESSPLRLQEGAGQTFEVPMGIAFEVYSIYLPLVTR